MIIYGTRSKKIYSERSKQVICNYCNEQRNHTITFYAKYFHIFWIPFFPIEKKGISECNHCKSTLDKKQMNPKLQHVLENARLNAKTPLLHWIGLFLFLFLFVIPIITSLLNNK